MVRSGGVLLAVALASGTAPCPGTGGHTSIAVGVDGRPVISYDVGWDVKLAHCHEPACPTAALSVLDPEGVGEADTSVGIGPDGLALVSYSAQGLKVAHCEDVTCERWSVTTLDASLGGGARYTSLAFGVDGLGLISYRDYYTGPLRVAHCENPACTRATITVLEPKACCVGRNSALTIGADGLGLIAYFDETLGLSTAHCENVACTRATKRPVVEASHFAGDRLSIRKGRDGLGLVAFDDNRRGGIVVGHCRDLACTGFDTDPLLEPNPAAHDTALAIGSDGLPLVPYTDVEGILRVAHCGDPRCQSSSISTLARRTTVGAETTPSIAIGPDGLAIIPFWDSVLKVARCVDVPCRSAAVTTLDEGAGPNELPDGS